MIRHVIVLTLFALLTGCIRAGEFTPERHAQYEIGQTDCNKTPKKCINGIPW